MARILLSIILIYWSASIVVLFLNLIWQDKFLTIFLVLGGVLHFIPFYLLLTKKIYASGFVSSGIYTLVVTAAATTGYGIHDYVVVMYPIIIMFAGLTAQKRGLFFSSLLVFSSFAWLILGEINGWFVVATTYTPDWADLFVAGILVVISGWAVHIFVANAQYGLIQTWHELAQRKRAESQREAALDKLRESEERYRIVADNVHDWAFWQSPDGRFIYSSPSCKHLTGHEADEFLQDPNLLMDIIHPDDRGAFLAHYSTIRENHVVGEIEFRILLPDGRERWIDHACQPIFDELGNYLGVRGSNRDITLRKHAEVELAGANAQLRIYVTEVVQLQAELREQALRDPLTGLYNRRYLTETLEREVARAEREKDHLSIIISDIDHFKIINDTFGHQVGDRFLVEIANLMKNNARGSDIVCRYGGEEFLLVIPGASMDDASKRADDIRRKCSDLAFQQDGQDLVMTISFGVATYPDHDLDPERIIIKADNALYQSKQTGRNRVTVWNENQSLENVRNWGNSHT